MTSVQKVKSTNDVGGSKGRRDKEIEPRKKEKKEFKIFDKNHLDAVESSIQSL